MGHGMAEFCTRRVESKEDYDLYCHYVAGLVGIGLSELFSVSGLEGKLELRLIVKHQVLNF
jgi:farnesyl-diphosphate farnesyltransferase